MIRALALQNCELETFGVYGEELLARDDVDLEVAHAYRGDPLPEADEWDLVLVGGTPISAYAAADHEFLCAELELLREALARQVPVLGICCGAQLLAMLLGATVAPASAMEIGGYDVDLTPQGFADPLLADFPAAFPVFHWHGDTFGIPRYGELLITGAECRNQMFRAGAVVGVQFHLETTAAEVERWTAAYRDELAVTRLEATDVIAAAEASETERLRLARLLLTNFIAEHVAPYVD